MAHDYTPKIFFRQTPNALLEAYFRRQAEASGADWDAVRAAKTDPSHGPWQALAKIETYLQRLRNDMSGLEDRLRQTAKARIDQRREKRKKDASLVDQMGFPKRGSRL